MLVGVISDTHDNAPNCLKAVALFNERKVKLVIHCGDWIAASTPRFFTGLDCKLVAVDGNNPGDTLTMLTLKEREGWDMEFHGLSAELDLGGKKALVFHGHAKGLLAAAIASGAYDVVFSGHTHKVVNERKGKTLHVNPGTVSGIGPDKGLDTPATVAIYDSEKGEAEIVTLA